MVKKYEFTQNRELSWLKFNQRVLEEAQDPSVPLLERLKFISIFTSNLDEFYMVRCGSLYDLSLLDEEHYDNKTGMSAQEQLDEIYKQTSKLYTLRDEIYKEIQKRIIKESGMRLNKYKSLTKEESSQVEEYFLNYVMPILSPQIIDTHHPFPHLTNKKLYIVCKMKKKNNKIFGLVPVPDAVDRIYKYADDPLRILLIEDIIANHVDKIFKDYEILFTSIVSVTRNADINLDPHSELDDEDYRQYMKKILKKRNRLAPIRLEFYRDWDQEVQSFLCKQLDISEAQSFVSHTPLDMSHVFQVIDICSQNKNLDFMLYKPFEPQHARDFDYSRSLISQVEEKDRLLFYPFEEIDPFLNLLKEAANDPDVLSIKITVYRLAKNSKIVKYLVQAADNGKDVLALMELRARFDESSNIGYAEYLENNGCRVIYGIENYKVHSKVCLITRKKGDTVEYITQIGTGNYNEKTSTMYTDYSYITARKNIGIDASNFFQNLSIGKLHGEYNELLVAPYGLKNKILTLIDTEIHKAKNDLPCGITMKMNSLTDLQVINKLVEASQAGVPIKLIIRGICCIVPGVKGFTDNVQVRSIVGRFLEHPRVYKFGDDKYTSLYIASADLMTRNTEKRVEVACPIYDAQIKERINHDLDIMWQDNIKARVLKQDGTYGYVMPPEPQVEFQQTMMDEAICYGKKAAMREDENHSQISENKGLLNFFKSLFKKNK